MTNMPGALYRTRLPLLRMLLWGGATTLFLIPVVAKLIGGDGMLWTGSDFIFAGVGIGIAAALVDLGLRKAQTFAYAVGCGIAVGICFLTIWANGAVGIVGNEDNRANAAFYGVVLFAAATTAIAAAFARARARAPAMARAMTANAIAQASAGVIVAVLGYLTPVFTPLMCLLWLAAAALFRKAGREVA